MELVSYVLLFVCIVIGYLAFKRKRNRPKDFSSEIVLVTGAAQGIGKALAREFASCGATLVLWDINETKLQSTREELEESGYKVHSYVVNCCKKDEIYAAAARVKAEVGDVTVLVSNAGVVNGKTVLRLTDEEIERIVDVNLLAHFWLVRTFLPPMIEKNHGYIVTMASISALMVAPMISDYSATKAATLNFSECLQLELLMKGKLGVSVTCVCPAMVDTEMFRRVKVSSTIMPVVKPSCLASEVVQAVANKTFLFVYPGWTYWFAIFSRFFFSTFFKKLLVRKAQRTLAKMKRRND